MALHLDYNSIKSYNAYDSICDRLEEQVAMNCQLSFRDPKDCNWLKSYTRSGGYDHGLDAIVKQGTFRDDLEGIRNYEEHPEYSSAVDAVTRDAKKRYKGQRLTWKIYTDKLVKG